MQHFDSVMYIIADCCVVLQVVALSDLFTERQQFEWMFDTLLEVQRVHPSDDELVQQYLITGICKAAAVIGLVSGQGLSTDLCLGGWFCRSRD